MSLEPVVDISKPKKVFSSLEEAQSFVAIIYRMTEKIYQEVQDSIELLETLNNQKTQTSSLYNNSTKKQKIDEISSRLNSIVETWEIKIEKLGLYPRGLWLVDIDSGTGYYCWKYPETRLAYWHSYEDGFSKRKPIENMITTK